MLDITGEHQHQSQIENVTFRQGLHNQVTADKRYIFIAMSTSYTSPQLLVYNWQGDHLVTLHHGKHGLVAEHVIQGVCAGNQGLLHMATGFTGSVNSIHNYQIPESEIHHNGPLDRMTGRSQTLPVLPEKLPVQPTIYYL